MPLKLKMLPLIASLLALPTMPLAHAAATGDRDDARASVPTPFTIFMLVKTSNDWLALSPEDRFAFLGRDIEPLLARHPDVRMRFFDAEAYNARVTDVVVWETRDLAQYQSLIEGLRESRFWGHYFEIVEILPAIEDGYAQHYEREPIGR
jgi:hypothetical protein